MKNKKVFFHIGLPKCASTSIQDSISRCTDIDYVGFVPGKINNKYWKQDKFAILFDRVLRFSCENIKEWKDIVHDYIEKSDKEIIVFSSESISLRFLSWDLPTHIKLKFVRDIFPDYTQYMYVYKNPVSTLISLYKEWILMGYSKSFSIFSQEVYAYKDISFFKDLLLKNFLDMFSDNLGNDNLKIFYLDKNVIKDLSAHMNVNLCDVEKKNTSITDIEADIICNYNSKMNDGDSFFDIVELHRAYFDVNNTNKYRLARRKAVRKSMATAMTEYSDVLGNKGEYELGCDVKNAFLYDMKSVLNHLNDKKLIMKIEQCLKGIENDVS